MLRNGKHSQLDPLFVIFEQHLHNLQDPDLDRKSFIQHVVKDYFSYLNSQRIVVPKSLEQPVIEELEDQIQTMLIKKIYGCLNIEEYQKNLSSQKKRRARSRYSKLRKKA